MDEALTSASRWRSRGFGIELDLGFEAPVFVSSPHTDAGGTPTRVELAPEATIRTAWPAAEARRTGLMGSEDRPEMVVHEHAKAGYLIELPPYGVYHVSADGLAVECAPPPVAWWEWQRMLIGQILPAVAALRGAEVLHASAVAVGGRAIAFAGDPGLGKSSLAVQMMLRGHRLLSEDVVAIRADPSRVLADPGARMLNLREDESELVGAGTLTSLGAVVGRSHGKVHTLVDLEPQPLPFGALYLLERDEDAQPVFERVDSPTFADIFRNAFVVYIVRADRMITQLDLAARLARSVPVFRLRIQPQTSARQLAEHVEAHAERLFATGERA
jgi:hypothetical protein